MLCLDYSNLQEWRDVSKLYMIARGYWFSLYDLENKFALVFFTLQEKDIFQRKYHWVEMKHLGAIQSRRRQLFCRRDVFFFSIYVGNRVNNSRVPTWIRKVDLKKSIKKQLIFSNSIFCRILSNFSSGFFTYHSQNDFIKVFYCLI